MAAIHDPKGELNLASLASAVRENLPHFARPIFLRLVRGGIDITGTFKLKKFRLQGEGFDPDIAVPLGDKVFSSGIYLFFFWED